MATKMRRIERHLHTVATLLLSYTGNQAAVAWSEASYTAVNWSLVSPAAISAAQTALVAPIGCTCAVSSASGQCPFFDCACACDLTAGSCDAFCCCDSECTVDHVGSVRSQGLCVDDELIKPSIEYCSTDLTIASASSGVNALLADSVLCVAVDNNEVVGDYINTPKEQSMAVANAFLQNPKQYSFHVHDGGDGTPTSTTNDNSDTYSPGDTIRIFSKSAQAPIHGPFLLGWSSSTGSSKCTQRNPVRFTHDWAMTSCVVEKVDLVATCHAQGGLFDPSAIAQNLLVAKIPSVSSATATSTDIVAVDVELQEINLVAGHVVALKEPYPTYYPQPQFTTSNSTNTSTCAGALVGVDYVIYHNGSGVIERVRAVVTIGNLTTLNTTIMTSSRNTPVDISQFFSVRFVSTAAFTRSLEKGNLATYERSGNPGYQLHLPVRVGVLQPNTSTSTTTAVSEMNGGLSLSGLGDCDDPTTLDTAVRFGEDAQLSCTLQLNASAFQSFCVSSDSVVPRALRVHFTHVARFGNADPFLVDEWLEIDYDEPTKSISTFSDASGAGTVELQCKNAISSLQIEFLVAQVGAANNPQNKIIAARASHPKADTLTFWKSPQDPAKRETYVLTRTVAFVRVKTAELDQWIPPTPPIWFSIPSDVFYPFQLSSAAANCHRCGHGTLALVGAVVLIVWLG